jgi:hypothetical protein
MVFNTPLSIESDTVDVYAHGADVLQALVSVTSSSDRDIDNNLMRLFITRRCFKKIGMCFRSRPFEKPILEILKEWKYDDAIDNLDELDGVSLPPCFSPSSRTFYFRPRSRPGYHRSVWTPGPRILVEQR